MPHIDYPADLIPPQANNLIVFDGVCVLCNGMVQFIIRRDKAARFHFMTAQSNTGQALYARMGMKDGDFETYFFIADGKVYEKFDAVLAVMARLGWPWKALVLLKPLPLALKNWLYDRVARNRYSLFGKRDACMVPEPSVKARFVT
jgi:predicted DCC family thiol-disulfide oxidoreductase YuxK